MTGEFWTTEITPQGNGFEALATPKPLNKVYSDWSITGKLGYKIKVKYIPNLNNSNRFSTHTLLHSVCLWVKRQLEYNLMASALVLYFEAHTLTMQDTLLGEGIVAAITSLSPDAFFLTLAAA